MIRCANIVISCNVPIYMFHRCQNILVFRFTCTFNFATISYDNTIKAAAVESILNPFNCNEIVVIFDILLFVMWYLL